MRKALLERFILVLLAALCINSVIFYIASSKMMLKNSKNDMTYTIKAVDSILDYDRDLMEQMERLEAFYGPGFQQGDPYKVGWNRCNRF